jgi:hypothetical protein
LHQQLNLSNPSFEIYAEAIEIFLKFLKDVLNLSKNEHFGD